MEGKNRQPSTSRSAKCFSHSGLYSSCKRGESHCQRHSTKGTSKPNDITEASNKEMGFRTFSLLSENKTGVRKVTMSIPIIGNVIVLCYDIYASRQRKISAGANEAELKRAAEYGNAEAADMLARKCLQEGGKEAEAINWLKHAVRLGSKTVGFTLQQVISEGSLSEEHMEKAKALRGEVHSFSPKLLSTIRAQLLKYPALVSYGKGRIHHPTFVFSRTGPRKFDAYFEKIQNVAERHPIDTWIELKNLFENPPKESFLHPETRNDLRKDVLEASSRYLRRTAKGYLNLCFKIAKEEPRLKEEIFSYLSSSKIWKEDLFLEAFGFSAGLCKAFKKNLASKVSSAEWQNRGEVDGVDYAIRFLTTGGIEMKSDVIRSVLESTFDDQSTGRTADPTAVMYKKLEEKVTASSLLDQAKLVTTDKSRVKEMFYFVDTVYGLFRERELYSQGDAILSIFLEMPKEALMFEWFDPPRHLDLEKTKKLLATIAEKDNTFCERLSTEVASLIAEPSNETNKSQAISLLVAMGESPLCDKYFDFVVSHLKALSWNPFPDQQDFSQTNKLFSVLMKKRQQIL